VTRRLDLLLALAILPGACSDPASTADGPVAPDAPGGAAFTIEVDPAVVLDPHRSAVATVVVRRVDAATGAIAVGVTGLPAGVTVDALTLGADEARGTLIFHSDGTGVAVSAAPIEVTGTATAGSAHAPSALTLRGVGIALAPTTIAAVSATRDTNVTFDIAATVLDSVAGPVGFRVDGLPDGVAVTHVEMRPGGATATLTIHAQAPAADSVAATVTASAGATEATATLTISVGTVSIALGRPTIAIAVGTTATIPVDVTRTATGLSVPISASGLPPGVTVEPLLLTSRETAGTLRLHAAGDAPLGGPAAAVVTAGATTGGACPVDCDVLAAAPLAVTVVAPFDLGLDVRAVTLRQGTTLPHAVAATVTRAGGFTGDVVLHIDGLPAGVTAPDLRLPSGAATRFVALAAGPAAPPGVAHLTVTATGAGFRRVDAIDVDIVAGGADSPTIASFTAADATVRVGERTTLTAVFAGDGAVIDGIGPVASGAAVDTPLLGRTTTFTLTVTRGAERAQRQVTVAAAYRDRFRALASSPVGRTAHVAAALPGGGAIVMGGNASNEINVPDSDSSDLFDPASERMSDGPRLPFRVRAAEFTTVAPLPAGGFLVIGTGINAGPDIGRNADVATARFDPVTGQFTRVGDALVHRRGLSFATDLGDGGVLLTGSGTFPGVPAVERFDADAGAWRRAADLLVARRVHTATRLDDGRVLIAGGLICCRLTPTTISEIATATAEIYDPDQDAFVATGSLVTARSLHTATRLLDGRVLIAGGITDESTPLAAVEIFDPATGQFATAPSLHTARGAHAAVLLTDGRVLVVGGVTFDGTGAIEATEIFDPVAGVWSPGPLLQPSWQSSSVTLLASGKILVFGGEDRGGFPEATTVLYE
jgi:hypothetical protein